MRATLTSSGPGLKNINAGLAALHGSDVLVGIPESNSSRKGGEINNAELLFIFTNGSPLRGQPPRVVIEAAIEADPTKGLIAKELGATCVSALNGDEAGMIAHLDRAGTIGESASKRWFTDPRNGWAPNKPSTIKAKGSDTPGIDTGQMRRAMTHVVEAQSLPHSSEGETKKTEDTLETPEQPAENMADNVGTGIGEAAEEVAAAGEATAAAGVGAVEGIELLGLL